MMDSALILSALLLGLAGMPHCAVMCGAPCAAAVGGVGGNGSDAFARSLGFHATRVVGYALAGALAAAGVGVLAMAGSAAPLVRPVWAMLHAAALGLGIWLLVKGRQPAFMTRVGRARPAAAAGTSGWQLMQTPWSAAAAGSVWVAWPCGLLQSALVVAALANSPQAGAAAMAVFAMASAGGLQAAPWLMRRAGAAGAGSAASAGSIAWAVRLAGLALVLGSAWALGHDLWGRVLAYCAA